MTKSPLLRLAPIVVAIAALLMAATPATAQSNAPQQTLVLLRHGEKPPEGLGLLTCQGLNRALLLPDFFAANFPPPDYIFAPDPAVKVTEINGDAERYDYVRPLLTIGPTAIRFGVPINAELPFNDPGLLADTLLEPRYHDAIVYVAWEHEMLVLLGKVLLKRFAVDTKLPPWPNSDYDTFYVVTIVWAEEPELTLEVRSEGFGEISKTCPTAAE